MDLVEAKIRTSLGAKASEFVKEEGNKLAQEIKKIFQMKDEDKCSFELKPHQTVSSLHVNLPRAQHDPNLLLQAMEMIKQTKEKIEQELGLKIYNMGINFIPN